MKYLATSVLALASLTALLPLTQRPASADSEGAYQYTEEQRIALGFQAAPVPLTYDKSQKELVGLGSYLVNGVGGCNDCHTNPSFAPGGNPYLGQPKKLNAAHYLAGGQAFGPFISRNITPVNGLPAGRTYLQFLNLMRSGTDYAHLHPKLGARLQVMPWPSYQAMSDHDLHAMYAYLSAIPSATPGS